jgi:hypothetical protein
VGLPWLRRAPLRSQSLYIEQSGDCHCFGTARTQPSCSSHNSSGAQPLTQLSAWQNLGQENQNGFKTHTSEESRPAANLDQPTPRGRHLSQIVHEHAEPNRTIALQNEERSCDHPLAIQRLATSPPQRWSRSPPRQRMRAPPNTRILDTQGAAYVPTAILDRSTKRSQRF